MNKYLCYFLSILKGHIFRRNIPILVTLCVTHRCNMKCVYCYGKFYERTETDLSREDIFHLIDEMAAAGTRYISLNGGEALLRGDIGDIVDKIRSKGLLCHLSTNGLLIKAKINILKKVDSIAVSIDGIGAENDLNRGEGTYQKILEGINLLREQKISFHIHTVITRHNATAVKPILKFAKELGVRAQFSLCRVADSPLKDIGLSDAELKKIVGDILELKRQGQPVFFSAQAYESFLSWPFSYDVVTMPEKKAVKCTSVQPCFIKRFSCHIEPDGRVYPCIVLSGKGSALNAKDVGFSRAWQNAAKTSCHACYNICCNDLNLIFAMNFRSIKNAIGIVWERLQ